MNPLGTREILILGANVMGAILTIIIIIAILCRMCRNQQMRNQIMQQI